MFITWWDWRSNCLYLESSNMMMNPILETDSYNATHWEIREKNEKQVAYMYNRNKPIIFFGLAGLVNTIFKTKVTTEHEHEAAKVMPLNNIKFNEVMWEKLRIDYGGDISRVIKIEQVPEFMWYPKGTPLARISSLHPDFIDLVTYFEGYLTKCYYTSEIMTRLHEIRRAGHINVHDFAYRGYRCEAEALLADFCFSLMYNGTDSLHVNLIKNRNFLFFEPYKKLFEYINPTTIAAASHAVIQSYEYDATAYQEIIKKMRGRSVAFPIDTYTHKKFFDNYLDLCLGWAAEYNTNLFFRIDSGDHINQAKLLLLKIIAYKQRHAVINYYTMPKFGIIIGDNMNLKSMNQIVNTLTEFLKKHEIDIRLDNYLYFGLGGKLTQGIDRELVGMVTKLGYADRPTMKTTNGKSSLLGEEMNVKMEQGKYVVVYSSDDGLYNQLTVNINNFNRWRIGEAFGYGNKLVITKTLKDRIEQFKEKSLRIV